MENKTTTVAEIIARLNARLDALEIAIEELTGKKIAAAQPQESAEAQAPEWDSLESLEEHAAEIHGQLRQFAEAFWLCSSQGKVCHARNAIHAVRVNENIFARRTRNATCMEAGLRDWVLAAQCDLAIALDWVEASLIDMMREGKGDETLRSQHEIDHYKVAMESFNEAAKICEKIYGRVRDSLEAAA